MKRKEEGTVVHLVEDRVEAYVTTSITPNGNPFNLSTALLLLPKCLLASLSID